MTRTPPLSKGRVSAFDYVGRQTINRALQLAFAFVSVIVVAAFLPL